MTNFLLDGPVGAIEALIAEPKVPPAAVAIICHPHPLQEGTMHNKVVTTLAKACDRCDAVTIRFNFRGVGQSIGMHDNAVGECDDLRAVIAFAKERYSDLPIWLAGFSFGSYVAARVANDDQVAVRLITIAPSVENMDFATLRAIQCPWLVIQGDADEVVSSDAVVTWWESEDRLAHQTLSMIPGVGHFFHGQLIALREQLIAWIQAS